MFLSVYKLTKISYPSVFLFLALFAETKMLASLFVDKFSLFNDSDFGHREEFDGEDCETEEIFVLFLRIDLFLRSLSK